MFFDIVVFNRRKTNIFHDITYIYLFTYVRMFLFFFYRGQRPSDARWSFVVCAHVKIRQRNISLFVAFTRAPTTASRCHVTRHSFRNTYTGASRVRGVALINVEAFIKAARCECSCSPLSILSPILALLLLSFFLALSPFPRSLGTAENTRGKILRRKTSIRYDVREGWKEFFSGVCIFSLSFFIFLSFFLFLFDIVRCVCKLSRARVSRCKSLINLFRRSATSMRRERFKLNENSSSVVTIKRFTASVSVTGLGEYDKQNALAWRN